MAMTPLNRDAGVWDATAQKWLTRTAPQDVPWSGRYSWTEEDGYRFSPADAFHRMHVYDEARVLEEGMRFMWDRLRFHVGSQ